MLVRFAEDGTDVEPSLATRWDVSDDGKEWTFHLRRDVKFHCAHPMDAMAVDYP